VTRLGLLGAPSSAAAHWPGLEKAPRALRDAGLLELLREAGHDLVDYGDLPSVRWRPHPRERLPHDLSRVLSVLSSCNVRVAAILEDDRVPLVIGGECTLAIPVVSAAVQAGQDVALLYFDGGPDLRTPEDDPAGMLDAMGTAHLLDLPGTAPELASFGPRRPLLDQDHVCFFGYTIEDTMLAAISSPRVHAAQVTRDPRAAARQAVNALTAVASQFVVHFDVDVIDFLDLPAADIAQHNSGLTLADAMTALSELTHHPGFAGLVVAEFNPDHGEPDGSTAQTLAAAIASALSAS
jgi:arginase